MKKIALIYLLLLHFSAAFSQTNTSYTTNVNGVNRTYKVYVPAIYNATQMVPLVFNFHGYGSNIAQQEAYGEFRPIADTANFIIIHPQGLSISGSTGWQNFTTVAAAQADINFVEKMITEVSALYNIDASRIYSTGMSNGGFMSYDLACFLSSRFAAIASVTGGMTALHKNSCQAMHPTPIMQIHGTADAVVNYDGSSLGVLSVDSLVKFWINFNHCNPTPVFTAVPDINTTDNCTAEHYVYNGGTNGATVELYKIIGGGHNWPGAIISINGNTNMDFSASKEIWRFFSKYRLTQLLNVDEINGKFEVSVYPNPASTFIKVEAENYENTSIEIYTASGQLITNSKLEGITTNVSLPVMAQGVYIYKIAKAGQIIQTGKMAINYP